MAKSPECNSLMMLKVGLLSLMLATSGFAERCLDKSGPKDISKISALFADFDEGMVGSQDAVNSTRSNGTDDGITRPQGFVNSTPALGKNSIPDSLVDTTTSAPVASATGLVQGRQRDANVTLHLHSSLMKPDFESKPKEFMPGAACSGPSEANAKANYGQYVLQRFSYGLDNPAKGKVDFKPKDAKKALDDKKLFVKTHAKGYKGEKKGDKGPYKEMVLKIAQLPGLQACGPQPSNGDMQAKCCALTSDATNEDGSPPDFKQFGCCTDLETCTQMYDAEGIIHPRCTITKETNAKFKFNGGNADWEGYGGKNPR